MLQLRNHLLPLLLRVSSHASASAAASSLHLRRLLLSTTATATSFSIKDYLVATCGLTGAQALKASKRLSHLKSASKPDAVLALLSGVGLSRADLAAIVASEPQLLCARADNVSRCIASLRDRVGLSYPQIGSLLLAGGVKVLRRCDMAPKLEFWIPFLGSFETLLKILKGNNSIIRTDLEKVIKPNIALLQERGLTVCDIVKMVCSNPRLLVINPERVKGVLQRAEIVDVPRYSWAFKYALAIVACNKEGTIAARMEFLSTTLGCSMDKLRSVVFKAPNILGLSEENLRRKIEFMVTEVGLEPELIVEMPIILSYSLENRMVPRHAVIKILQASGLIKEGVQFNRLLRYGEKDFIARYIDPHKHTVPGLADVYDAACSGKMPALPVPESILKRVREGSIYLSGLS